MLHEFLKTYREDLISRCRAKVALRPSPRKTTAEINHGIPLFLDQLIKTLQIEQKSQSEVLAEVSMADGGCEYPVISRMDDTASRHGGELMKCGFTVDQVVHDYGDLCQAITDLACDLNLPITVDEFRTLNRCLDDGIAVAVTEFNFQRDSLSADMQTQQLNQRLGFFSHELRNFLNSATLALSAIQAGQIGVNGATSGVLSRSLVGMRNLIDRSLSEVRLTAGLPVPRKLFLLEDFISEVRLTASLEARVKECTFTVPAVEPDLAVDADRDLLLSAVGNLLQNAFKFTAHHSEVTLRAYSADDRILIDVEDHCGGLPVGNAERLFQPFIQRSADKSGVGLGLAIARRSVESNDGILSVRDLPGSGCVFTISLPRHSVQ